MGKKKKDSAVRFVDADFKKLVSPHMDHAMQHCARDEGDVSFSVADALTREAKYLSNFAERNDEWWDQDADKINTLGDVAQLYWLTHHVLGLCDLETVAKDVLDDPECYERGSKEGEALEEIKALLPHFELEMKHIAERNEKILAAQQGQRGVRGNDQT